MQTNRRSFLRLAAAGGVTLGAGAVGVAATDPRRKSGAGVITVAEAGPAGTNLGELADYAGGVLSAEGIRSAGFVGAVRYVSDRRPGAEWALAKPILADEAALLTAAGLQIVSVYQYGKEETADWLGGFDAGVEHANRGLELHRAAGGPEGRPIYAAIDDDPSAADYRDYVAPYLRGWGEVLGTELVGVYCNSTTIDWAVQDGLARWFWMHEWGTPNGYVHPSANIHQYQNSAGTIEGVSYDRNRILTADYGQWSLAPGAAAVPAAEAAGAPVAQQGEPAAGTAQAPAAPSAGIVTEGALPPLPLPNWPLSSASSFR